MTGRARVMAGLALMVLPGSCAGQTQLRDVKVIESVAAPAAIQGLAASDGNLWSIDSRKGTLLKFRAGERAITRAVAARVDKPKAVAWDGSTLWCAGAAANRLHQVDPASGRILKTVEIQMQKVASPVSLESLAWDGKTLWVGHSAGWSSRLSRVDVATGRVIQSLFSEGVPRALTSDGKYLWMATYNNGKLPSLLAQWTILEDPGKMSRTHKFLARLPGKEPVGLARDGQMFWYADRERKSFEKIQLPAEQ